MTRLRVGCPDEKHGKKRKQKRSTATTGYKTKLAGRLPLPCISVLHEGGVTEEAVPLARNDPRQVETVKHGNYRTRDMYCIYGRP